MNQDIKMRNANLENKTKREKLFYYIIYYLNVIRIQRALRKHKVKASRNIVYDYELAKNVNFFILYKIFMIEFNLNIKQRMSFNPNYSGNEFVDKNKNNYNYNPNLNNNNNNNNQDYNKRVSGFTTEDSYINFEIN